MYRKKGFHKNNIFYFFYFTISNTQISVQRSTISLYDIIIVT